MKFMTLVKARENHPAGEPPMELFAGIDQLGRDAAKEGVFVLFGGLAPASQGTAVKLAKGEITVTDGPFAEAKEVIGGFAVYDTETKEEAVKWAVRFMELHKKHWPDWDGEVEVRELMNFEGPGVA
ncbi:MAG: hypothetical protein IT535_13425 [Bauldia sp.]|nr:hypothetical protein [Bauldia sp.]